MIIAFASVGALPKDLSLRFKPDDIDLDNDGELRSDAVFAGEAFLADGKVHIEGRLNADVRRNCTRCLESTTDSLDVSVNAVFVDASKEELDEERELSSADLDESLVIGGEIDLKEVVREQILLALPDKVYCSDSCKGLCPECGADLNLIDCKCAESDLDPRWAALKNLR